MQTMRKQPALRPSNRQAAQLPAISAVWKTLEHACDLRTKKTPVPNSRATWCQYDSRKEKYFCDFSSCNAWWLQVHPRDSALGREGWRDEHPVYEELKKACAYIDALPNSELPLATRWHQKGVADFVRDKITTTRAPM